ncbi:hypothetical protein HK098_002339 [Nowakowskiella sp. JEL0407]|nr:hypothetical protein HK098_002339 [Nowakowskiella sp. JEL0407]
MEKFMDDFLRSGNKEDFIVDEFWSSRIKRCLNELHDSVKSKQDSNLMSLEKDEIEISDKYPAIDLDLTPLRPTPGPRTFTSKKRTIVSLRPLKKQRLNAADSVTDDTDHMRKSISDCQAILDQIVVTLELIKDNKRNSTLKYRRILSSPNGVDEVVENPKSFITDSLLPQLLNFPHDVFKLCDSEYVSKEFGSCSIAVLQLICKNFLLPHFGSDDVSSHRGYLIRLVIYFKILELQNDLPDTFSKIINSICQKSQEAVIKNLLEPLVLDSYTKNQLLG